MMRKNFFLALSISAILAVASSALAADPLFYVDFDDQPLSTFNPGDQLTLTTWYERGTSVTAIFAEAVGGGSDTVDVKVPDGNGTDYPSSAGPQGGKAMIIGSGGYEEGLNVEMSSPYHTGDYTVEVAFWLSTNNLANNLLGIQNIWDSSWPSGDVLHNSLRVIGTGIGPARDQHIEMVCWQGDATEVRVETPAVLTPQVWHTAQFLFDYNNADPSNSSFSLYLDGTLQGSATYNATASVPGASFTHFWGLFGTPATDGVRVGVGSWRFFLGCSINRQISFTDVRGMKGAIDAFVISEGLLSPSEFVLPAGFDPGPPPVPLGTGSIWSVYE